MANAAGFRAPGVQTNIFGKTSGWYHGVKFDTLGMWKAAMNRESDTLKRCLKAGLNVNHSRWVKGDVVVGTGARTIADVVACRNDVTAMRLLIEHGVDLSGTTVATYVSKTQPQRDALFYGDDRKLAEKDTWTTPLHLACRYGYADLVRIVLDEGHADPNTMDSQSRVALQMVVIWGGKLDVAKLLLDRGAMVDAKDNLDSAPLAVAAFLGKLELVELFLDHGAVIDATDSRGETALYNASLRNHSGVIAELAARGANLDLQNIDGMSAFFKAASTLKTDTMDILTKCGADTDTRDNNGCTALARATMANNIPLITHLLQLGVDIDAEDNDGWTPLFVAMIHNEENLIRLLLTYRSNMEKIDNHGNTDLHQAAILGATLVVRYILALNPFNSLSYSQLNLFGETPLALASKHDRSPIVKVLLKHGANLHHVDPNGHRALDRAMYWGSFACVRLLLKAGASVDSRALIALQQGKLDNCGDARKYNMIFSWLKSQYPPLVLPTATKSSRLADHFARTLSHGGLRGRMHEKQGKPNLVLDPLKDGKSDEVVSSDPFEACIPKTPHSQIINNSTMNIKVNGNSALEIGEIGTSLALGITNTVLGL